jgi:REP-associated tyrosine transposase
MDLHALIRQGKVSRVFRATKKLRTPNLVSHITQRAAGKDVLFIEKDDYLNMLGLIKEISGNHDVTIYAFCLMPNHVHMLLSPGKDNLQDAMRSLFSRYAMRFNRKYERKGHLFGGPYRQAVCFDDSYLLAGSLYIHLNPARAGLCKDPLAYRWSSCRLYCTEGAPPSFVDADFVLRLLSSERLERVRRYLELVRGGADMDLEDALEAKDAMYGFLGNLRSRFPLIFHFVQGKRRVVNAEGPEPPGTELLGRQIQAAASGDPRSSLSREAKRYLIEQLISRGYTRIEIAKRLGVSRKTVYNILRTLST